MPAEEIETTAASWLAREDRGLLSAQGQQALERWLEQSHAHKVAYLRLKAAWRRADRLAALRCPAPLSRSRGWRALPGTKVAAIAAVLLVAAAGAAWLFWHQPTASWQDYATGVGENRTLRLADGTQVELNTDTRLRTRVTDGGRTVMLESGEAYFAVVHDPRRPFTVYAGNRRITDIGTRFSVMRTGEEVRVLVEQGQVRVDQIDQPRALPLWAQAGREIITKGAESLVAAKPQQEVSNDLSWRRGVLVFNQQTLADAAEQFNRYNNRHIDVEGSARKIHIGGSFKADNVDVFVALLHRGFGLTVSTQGDKILVTR